MHFFAAREYLAISNTSFTTSALSVIQNQHQKESLHKLIKCLQNIQTIRKTIDHIEFLLVDEQNFLSAIHLYYETFHILEEMASEYKCVQEMKLRLSRILVLAEQQMDLALSKLPHKFCSSTFASLCKAYKQIGKWENCLHSLIEHFIDTVHDQAFSIVYGYVQLFVESDSIPISNSSSPVKHPSKSKASFLIPSVCEVSEIMNDSKRKTFFELSRDLKPESFLSCLIDMCRAMWDILYNYYQVFNFFESSSSIENSDPSKVFVIEKMHLGMVKVWSEVQRKVCTLVSSVQFVEPQKPKTYLDQENNDNIDERMNHDQLLFPFEEFIKILAVCERFLEVGQEFCSLFKSDYNLNCATSELQKVLYKQTRDYFQSYHQVSMAELKIFLENEIWAQCPVETTNDFVLIASLHEFSFMKNCFLKAEAFSSSKSTESNGTECLPRSTPNLLLSPTRVKTQKHYFHNNDNSFSAANEDLFSYQNDQKFFDSRFFPSAVQTEISVQQDGHTSQVQLTESHHESDIALTNTGLTLLRLTGRYMNIMCLLRPISHDVVKALTELFDYYFYAVYCFFALDSSNSSWLDSLLSSASISSSSAHGRSSNESTSNSNTRIMNNLSSELFSFVRRVNETLIQTSADSKSYLNSSKKNSVTPVVGSSSSSSNQTSPKRSMKYSCPTLPHYLTLNSQSNLFALSERIMAIESL